MKSPSHLPPLLLFLYLLSLALAADPLSAKIVQNISSVRSMLVGRSLTIQWKLSDDTNFRINSKTTMINQQSDRAKRSTVLFDFFEGSDFLREGQGFFEAEQMDAEASSLYLRLLDGRFHQNSTVVLQISLSDGMEMGVRSDKTYVLWQSLKKQFISCLLLHNEEIVGKFSVGAQIEIYTSIKSQEDIEAGSTIIVTFQSSSFSFRAELRPITGQYTALVIVVVVCSALYLLAVVFFKPRKTVYNLSEWMIIQVAAFVVASNFILFGQAFSKLDTNLSLVAICSVSNIIVTMLFLRNYEDVVFNEFNNKKKALILIGYLLIYFVLVYFFHKNLVFWIYEAFLLMAVQMSYSYAVGGRGGMAIKLVTTIIVTRIPFVYYRYYSEVLTRSPNEPKLLITFIGITIIMLTFVTLQRYFGSRFLIPKELIPDYFNYFHRETDPEILKQQCPVCTLALEEDPDSKETQNNKLNESSTSNKGPGEKTEPAVESERGFKMIMATPCDHKFHRSCLQDWMDKRLNCPMCRAALPPSEQQRDDSYCC